MLLLVAWFNLDLHVFYEIVHVWELRGALCSVEQFRWVTQQLKTHHCSSNNPNKLWWPNNSVGEKQHLLSTGHVFNNLYNTTEGKLAQWNVFDCHCFCSGFSQEPPVHSSSLPLPVSKRKLAMVLRWPHLLCVFSQASKGSVLVFHRNGRMR